MADGPAAVTDLAGSNLSIDPDGVLNATDTRTDVSDDGRTLVEDVTNIDFGTNLSVTSTDDSVTVNAAGSPWTDTDDDGLLEPGTDFEGIDVQRVETEDLAVGNVGVSVFSIVPQTIDEFLETVRFDRVAFDHRSEFGINEFVPSSDGVYSVAAAIQCSVPGEGNRVFLTISRDGDIAALDDRIETDDDHDLYLHISKLLRLFEGESVTAQVDADAEIELRGGESRTWMTARRVG